MKKIKGKYGIAKVFTDDIEQLAIDQISILMDQPFAQGTHARFMPDVHTGKGCTIGTTMIIKDKICPNLIGVDIGCGMLLVNLGKIDIDLPLFDEIVNKYIPSGFAIHDEAIYSDQELKDYDINFEDIVSAASKRMLDYHKRSIGTLGGGNHFIELNKDDDGNIYLVIHSGSRYLGKKVCEYYQNRASKAAKDKGSKFYQIQHAMIDELKSQGRQKEIPEKLHELQEEYKFAINELAYIDKNLTDDFDNYIKEMHIAQKYASLNRKTIAQLILINYFKKIKNKNEIKGIWDEEYFEIEDLDKKFSYFETIHNYLEISDKQIILRKGAISCKKDEVVLIPLNMRDGSLLCIGKGNEDWNYSGPHGAGRKMSRAQARENISLETFKDSMKDVYSTSVVSSTIDEAPMAYKDSAEIINNIHETVEIIKQIKPIYNFKAS